jgi:cysteine synthase A
VIDDAVGNTPVISLRSVGPVRLKLETRSPNATVMDRVARRMAKEAGEGPWREAGDGALAIAVAMQGALHGHAVEVFLPEGVTLEVRQSLLVYRAKVTLTPFAEGPQGAIKAARAAGPLLRDKVPRAFPEAFAEIGRELLSSEPGLEAIVAPRAMLGGIASSFAKAKAVTFRPFEGPWRPHRQAGVFPGPEAEASGGLELVDDETAWKMRERLGREEGLLLSIGAAAGVEAACRVARALGPKARVCAIAFDTGERDFSLAGQF